MFAGSASAQQARSLEQNVFMVTLVLGLVSGLLLIVIFSMMVYICKSKKTRRQSICGKGRDQLSELEDAELSMSYSSGYYSSELSRSQLTSASGSYRVRNCVKDTMSNSSIDQYVVKLFDSENDSTEFTRASLRRNASKLIFN